MTRLGRVPAFPTLRHAIDAAAAALAEAGVGSPRTDAELLAAHVAGTDRGRLAFADTGPEFRDRYDELVAPAHEAGTAATPHRYRGVRPGDACTSGPACSSRDRRPSRCWNGLWRNELSPTSGHRRPVHGFRCAGARAGHKHWPDARVIAVDDSDDALAYARRNAAGTPVELVQADVTAPGLLAELDGQVDLVVANPPYIPDGAALEPEVAEHDPPHALFGGPDGMAVIDRIVELAARLLRDGGRCAVEHDDTTSARTVEAFTRTARFVDVTARHDLTGRPRFVTAARERLTS